MFLTWSSCLSFSSYPRAWSPVKAFTIGPLPRPVSVPSIAVLHWTKERNKINICFMVSSIYENILFHPNSQKGFLPHYQPRFLTPLLNDLILLSNRSTQMFQSLIGLSPYSSTEIVDLRQNIVWVTSGNFHLFRLKNLVSLEMHKQLRIFVKS